MKKVISLLWLLLLLPVGVHAAGNNDFQLWTELKYSHRFGKSPWTLYWSTESRFDNDVSRYFLFISTIGFDYRIKEWVKGGFAYKILKQDGSPLENRIYPEFEFTVPLGITRFQNRERFEVRIFTDGDVRFRYRSRFKFSLPVGTKPVGFSPYVADELFVESGSGMNQNRFAVGNAFIFAGGHITFDLYYMLRRDAPKGDATAWTNAHILGTSLAFAY